jgi:hypothetical protein
MMEPRCGAILIDASEDTDVDFDRAFLKRLGHPVVICHGPPHGELCPILRGSGCPLVDAVHGIIFEFDLERPQHRAILRKCRERVVEDVPIEVIVRPGQDVEYADLLAGVKVWTRPMSAGELDGFAAEVEAYDRVAG